MPLTLQAVSRHLKVLEQAGLISRRNWNAASFAQVAETTYTAFSGRWRVTARLIVRRIPDLRKSMVDDQGVLFPVWRYHTVFTDSPFVLVQAEEQHRGHAIERMARSRAT